MKTEAQIKHKLAQVRYRHLKRELRTGLSRRPSNCRHNGVVELPIYGQVGICLLKTDSSERVVCDALLGDRSPSCDTFDCPRTKESIRSEFEEFLRHSNRDQIGERYPDLAALLWVLELETDLGDTEESTPPSDTTPTPLLPAQSDSSEEVASTSLVLSEPASLWVTFRDWFRVFFARLRSG